MFVYILPFTLLPTFFLSLSHKAWPASRLTWASSGNIFRGGAVIPHVSLLTGFAMLFPTPPSALGRSVAWRNYKRLRRRVFSDRLTDWVFELSDWLFVQLTDSLFISYLRNIFLIEWFRWYISAHVTLATNNDVTTRNEIKTNSSLKDKIWAKEHYLTKASYARFSGIAINTSNNTRVFNTRLCRGYPWTRRSVVTSLPQPYGWRIFCADVKLFHALSKI